MKCESVAIMYDDRRLGLERRSYEYSGHFPERRDRQERRCGDDRRFMDAGREHGFGRRLTD